MNTTTTFDPDRVTTITVDSYGTLVDTDAVEARLAERVPDPEPVSKLWRSRSLMYTMVGNFIGYYQPFYEMNRNALEYALDAHDVDLSSAERDEILGAYHELDVFPDVRDGIERLRAGGYPVYVLSNGNPEMLRSMVRHAGIADVVADTISADEIRTFKPHPDIYRHGAARTGTPIDEIVHVAGPAFDVLGAMHAGMQGSWINRDKGPWESFADVSPDLTIDSFDDLAEILGV
ncbi:haloacid dehalogenase type II [Halomarina halobia]|uniref:Haloacid dehalogenase type II n=1 Tax=Halomarina halobia TaxID=3033386 RepID=A0ABD6A911_9EURY|nr:haloacid dehalogenase type II [Halomarina sp. PSR21]